MIGVYFSGTGNTKHCTEKLMDDIAKTAGYSKATLYVYFENKEEIVGILVLESMKKLYGYIDSALARQDTTKARYDAISGVINCKRLLNQNNYKRATA